MTKLIKGILIFANILVFLSLLLAKIASTVSPDKWLFPSYFSFAVFPLILANLFFLLFWIFTRKWWFLLPLFSFVLFFGIMRAVFPVNLSKPKVNEKDKKITFLTYNTMAMGNMKEYSPEKSNPVVQYILFRDADIVCLQEFAISDNEGQFQEKDFKRYFDKYPYRHIKYKLSRWNMHQGLVTLSKYPIINKQDVDYEAKFNLSIYSDIVIGDDTVRVINNHLESNRITAQDMQQTSQLRKEFDSEKLTDITKYLSGKLGTAAKVRAAQAKVIDKLKKNTPPNYRMIVCGDFNDVPAAYTYTKVKGNLHDAFCENETGLGWTYNRSLFRFRIDYILYDDSFTSANYKRGNLRKSDHYPVQVDLYLKKRGAVSSEQ